MDVIGMTKDEIQNIFSSLAAILHLGNVAFKEEASVSVPVDDSSKFY